MKNKIIAYVVSVGLLIIAFFIPPQGEIHPSVLIATSIIIFGWEFLFGKTIKKIDIDKEGIHMETFNKDLDV